MVTYFGKVAVLEYSVGPAAGYIILDSIDPAVSVRVLDGFSHLEGEDGIHHAATCRCRWCRSMEVVLGYGAGDFHNPDHADDGYDHEGGG